MNSLKSFCSFTERLTVASYELEKYVQPLLRPQRGEELDFGFISVPKAVENRNDAFH